MMASIGIPGTQEEIQDLINRKLSAKVCATPLPKFPGRSADTQKKKEFLVFASRNSASTICNAPSGSDDPTLLSKPSPAASRAPSPIERSKSPLPHSSSLKQSNSIRPVNGLGSNDIGSHGNILNGRINHNLNNVKKSSSRASSPLSRNQSPSGQTRTESPIFYKNDKPSNRPASDFSGYTVQAQNVERITTDGQTYVYNKKLNGGDASGKKTEKSGKSKKSPRKKDPKKEAGGGAKKSKTPVDTVAAKEETMQPENIAGEQAVVISNDENRNVASEVDISEPVGSENGSDRVNFSGGNGKEICDGAEKTTNGGRTESDLASSDSINGNTPNGIIPSNDNEPQRHSPEHVSEVRQIDVLNEIATVPPRPMGKKKKATTPLKGRTAATTTMSTTETALKAPVMSTAGPTTSDQRTSTVRVPLQLGSSDATEQRAPPNQGSSETASGRGRRRERGKGKGGVSKSSANSNANQAAAILRSTNFGQRGNYNKSDSHTNGVTNCYKTNLDEMSGELKWERSHSSASTAYGVPPPMASKLEVKVDLDADDFSDGFYSSTMKKTPSLVSTFNGASAFGNTMASAIVEFEDEVNAQLVDPGGLIPHPIKASLANFRFDKESLCPMCREKGVSAKLRFCFIALEEGVWMCLTDGCPFPFGLETKFFSFTRDMENLGPEIRN